FAVSPTGPGHCFMEAPRQPRSRPAKGGEAGSGVKCIGSVTPSHESFGHLLQLLLGHPALLQCQLPTHAAQLKQVVLSHSARLLKRTGRRSSLCGHGARCLCPREARRMQEGTQLERIRWTARAVLALKPAELVPRLQQRVRRIPKDDR